MILLCSSCSYMDYNVRMKKGDFDSYFTYYSDSIIFNYARDIIYRMDSEYLYPIPFSLTLPSGITDYYYVNSSEFVFYYKSDQLIYIIVDLKNPQKNEQVQYQPSKTQIDSLLSTSDPEAGKIYDIQVDMKKRKNLIIEKDSFTILFCNIKAKNYDDFLKIVAQSKLLR